MIRLCFLAAIACASPALAHDTWVETNTNAVRTGDAIYIDLKLGNHGNEHRDFKLAGKAKLAGSTLEVIAPTGTHHDLIGQMWDAGSAPADGYWSTKYVPTETGLYVVAHTLDQVVHYAPIRAIKSAKTMFIVGNSGDLSRQGDPSQQTRSGFAQALGHSLEIVPLSNPVEPMGPGQELEVQLLRKGKPLANTRVSFIPRGHELGEGFDAQYERMTDAEGRARFTPRSGNIFLITAHHTAADESGENYESTKYAASLTVFVPERRWPTAAVVSRSAID